MAKEGKRTWFPVASYDDRTLGGGINDAVWVSTQSYAKGNTDVSPSTQANLAAIESVGGSAMIPFKRNATPAKGGLWAKMFHYFCLNRDEFLNRYHLRSNVESTFSMIKAKFRDSVRSKNELAMKNEVAAKIVCHNICCLISAMYELVINPVFYAENQAAQKIGQN